MRRLLVGLTDEDGLCCLCEDPNQSQGNALCVCVCVCVYMYIIRGFSGGTVVKNPAALEEELATHSSFLAWRISWTEEPDGVQSIGSQKVGRDRAT